MENKPMKILLIEDNPDHREIIINELKNNGGLINEIHIAKDGEEALDFLFHRGKYNNPNNTPLPGLILLDLKLPKIDGIEVLKQIKSDENLKIIPVIILTTSSQDEDIVNSYSNGTNSFITKPVKFEEFIKVIQEIKFYWILTNKSPKK